MLRCGDCGSAQISPMPSPDKVAELYPPVYSFRPDFDTSSRAKSLIARAEEAAFYRLLHKRETETVKRHTGMAGGSMLDVGCGTGDRLVRFARAGFTVRGLEIQPELVSYVHDTLGFAADAGTLDTVSYDDNSFDIVTIYYVIEHLLDVKAVLKKIYAMLKPGGWIVAEMPLADSCQSRVLRTRWSQYSEAPRHVAIPSREGIQTALSECGFQDFTLLPATMMNCAGAFALSVIPNATSTHAYEKSGLVRHLPRVAGGVLTLLYFPAVALENYALHRPAFGLILARKPC
jgi:2-polyprenyl-3-methyl-5-hydroxy-6-metoxy-1,4-benzoquinol methylase